MTLKELIFTPAEFAGNDIASLPDVPAEAGMTSTELKARFDRVAKEMLALGRFNDLLAVLTDPSAAGELGAAAPAGQTGETVQAVLASLAATQKTHAEDAVCHLTAAEREKWDAKQSALCRLAGTLLPGESTDETAGWRRSAAGGCYLQRLALPFPAAAGEAPFCLAFPDGSGEDPAASSAALAAWGQAGVWLRRWDAAAGEVLFAAAAVPQAALPFTLLALPGVTA